MPQTTHEWSPQDFVAGELCLELTNTVGDHSKTRSVEWLTGWDVLLDWTVAAGALDAAEAQELRKIGRRDPTAAGRSIQRMLKFRDLLFRVLSTLAAGRAPAREDLDRVETIVLNTLRAAHLMQQDQNFRWAVRPSEVSMSTPLARIALSTLQLLQGDDLSRLRECQRCSWLFLDRSKSHGRRWCRADACGNRARVARHYRARAP
jgi:predicted RNA-binding Zn ribbon-like protein